jgi:(2Fe-2S) ferredoxin
MAEQINSFYRYHLFFCTNQRQAGEACCENHQAQAMRDYVKARSKELDLIRHGVRANTAGCLNRCKHGPVLVIYPQGVWYSYKNQADIDEIITQHLQQHQIVERLQIKD